MKSIFLSFLFVLIAFGCKNSDSPENKNNSQNTNEEKIMVDSTVTDTTTTTPVAVVKTNMGTIEIELFEKQTPKTVENFIGLAKKNYYDGIIFHRVIEKFMIQGGDPTGTGRGGQSLWGKAFEDEIVDTLKFDKPGILAMANAGPNTNGSQFFITTVPTAWLNGNHTIFGKVINGMDVVSAIEKVQKGPQDKPVKNVVMEKVTIERRDPSKKD
jgi:cyclophilin family peptidyl-prolyl cis-trans isomerase